VQPIRVPRLPMSRRSDYAGVDGTGGVSAMPYEFGGFTLDEKLHQLRRGGERVELRRQVFDFLAYLVENSGRLVTKRECFDHIWEGRAVSEHTLAQCGTAARRALGDTARNQKMIETEYGKGFRFTPEVRRVIDVAPGFYAGVASPARPAIAVLPFENRSGQPEQDYFAEGIGDDLLMRLTSWRVFPVISRSSSYAYRGGVDPKQVGLELGAGFIVEGGVRRAADELRVNVRLTDAATGTQVWADRYSGTLDRVFKLQDEISESIAGAVTPQVLRIASAEAARREPRSLDAWDHVLRGVWHMDKRTRDDNACARGLFEKASRLDAEFAFAVANLGNTHYYDLFQQWTDDVAQTLESLARAADACLRLDAHDPAGHVLHGLHQMVCGRREGAIASFKLALDRNPSLATTQSLVGQMLAMGGRPEEGRGHVESAIRLSRRDPRLDVLYTAFALVEYCSDDYASAIDWAERALRLQPASAINYGCIAASCAHLGQLAEARDAVASLRERWPDFSVAALERLLASAEPKYRDSFRAGLRTAGVPT